MLLGQIFLVAFDVGVVELLDALVASLIGDFAKTFLARGLQLNFDEGKCALLLSAAGPYARKYRHKLLIECGAKVKVPDLPCHLKVTHSYKHLGTQSTVGLRMGCEISARIAAHAKASGPLKKVLVARKGLSVVRKNNVIDALATSVLLSNAGAWVPPTRSQLQRLDFAAAELFRKAMQLLWSPGKRRQSTERVFRLANKLPPSELVIFARLRLLERVMTECPPALRFALDSTRLVKGSWSHALLGNIEVVKTLVGTALPASLCLPPGDWPRAAAAQRRWTAVCRTMQLAFLDTFNRNNAVAAWQRDLVFKFGKLPHAAKSNTRFRVKRGGGNGTKYLVIC